MRKIREWTQQSLKTRLNKSLTHDWIPEKRAHKFPLRQYYVQLEWEKKERTVMETKRITLTSLHDLIKQIKLKKSPEEAANVHSNHVSSVLVEGMNHPWPLDIAALIGSQEMLQLLNHS